MSVIRAVQALKNYYHNKQFMLNELGKEKYKSFNETLPSFYVKVLELKETCPFQSLNIRRGHIACDSEQAELGYDTVDTVD